MSDIRFNQWLHQSGTGGVSQVASGAVGVGTTNPLADFYVRGDAQITGILTAGHIAMGSSITFGDNDRIYLGDGTDFQLYHASSDNNSYIVESGAGSLVVNASKFHVKNAANNEDIAVFNQSGNNELYFSNSKKFETTNTGAVVTGILTATSFSGGLIKHTGQLKLIAPASNSVRIRNHDDSDNVAVFNIDGSTHLYYDSSHKFSTVSDGIDVVGNILMMDSLTHRGDTNTKIRFPADDTVSVETGGTERLRIDSRGRIGIGIADPDAYQSSSRNLVIGKASDAAGITIRTGTSNGGYIRFADGTSGNQAYRGTIAYVHSLSLIHI